MIGMSACLGGIACRYDGCSAANNDFNELINSGKVTLVCPEVLAGLPIPRNPAEIVGGDGNDVLNGKAQVLEDNGTDVTNIYIDGASKAYDILRKQGIKILVLKENSSTCGSQWIYDGSFSSVKKSGVGVATALFRKRGILVYSDQDENTLQRIYQYLSKNLY